MEFRTFVETSITGLYHSAVNAFPHTQMRQHATHPVRITSINWTPHPRFKTIYIRGLAQSEGREYNPTVLLKNVKFHPHAGHNLLAIATTKGDVFIEQLSLDETPVQVRCNCGDFQYRFRYYNFMDHSLFGPKGQKYDSMGLRGPINPTESPGLCKHIIKLVQALYEAELLV